MPADLGGAASHPAVAALLAVTHPLEAITSDSELTNDPEVIAARQAAAVLRWAADAYGPYASITAVDLRETADEIDPKEGDDDGR